MAPNPADLGAGRPSDCAPWRRVIEAKLDQGLTAQRIYQDLVTEHGFVGSYYSVRRFTRRLGQGRSLPFRGNNISGDDRRKGVFYASPPPHS